MLSGGRAPSFHSSPRARCLHACSSLLPGWATKSETPRLSPIRSRQHSRGIYFWSRPSWSILNRIDWVLHHHVQQSHDESYTVTPPGSLSSTMRWHSSKNSNGNHLSESSCRAIAGLPPRRSNEAELLMKVVRHSRAAYLKTLITPSAA
ncbi:hypothetical protein BGZ63DRAFT_203418 [Mariannaea sp. PMI_226]|nr:hypothetical protein BGZ63DRAFT_203418 [Mariannaea sp. PMI_226]